MNPATSVPTSHAEALVVEQDPGTRGQLIQALSRRGYGIKTCSTLAEGRQQFARQRLIVTHANGDTPELRGFVDYVRKCAGGAQPYILAVGEAESPSGLSANRLGLNDFLATPFDDGELTSHLEAVAEWLNGQSRDQQEELPGDPESSPPSRPVVAHAAAMLGHYCPILLDQVPQAIAMFDTELRYLVANQRYLREFGLAGHPIVGRSHYELFPDLHETWRQLFDRALAGEIGRIDEDFFRRSDGSSDWVRWEVRPWLNEEGGTGGVVLTQEVITEQKRSERRQRFGQNLAKSLFESTALPALLVALDGRVLRSSPAARQCLGLQPTIDGRLLFWTVYPDPASEAEEKQRFESQAPAWVAGEPFSLEPGDIIVPGVPAKVLHWTASPHRSSSGQIEAVLLTGTLAGPASPSPAPPATPPAAPSVEAESVLSRDLPFGLVVIERDGHVSYANDAVGSLLGHPFNAAAGFEAWLELGAPEELQREPILREWRDNVWRRQLSRVFSLATAEGLLKEIELRPRLLSDGRLLLTISDVTESRRTEDALRTSETKYRSLFHQFPAGIALADRAGVIIDANPALEKLTGFTRAELRRLRIHELLTAAPATVGVHLESPLALVRTQSGDPMPVLVTIGPICNVAGEPVLQAYFIQHEREPDRGPDPEGLAADLLTPIPTPIASSSAASEEEVPPDAWLDLAFAGHRAALIVTDLRGRVRAANPAALQFFGYDQQGLVGGGLYRLFRPDDPAGFSREVSERINLFRCWEGETGFVRADGTTGRCLAEVTPASGTTSPGLLCVVRPLSEPVGR